MAKKSGFTHFTTSLLASPYQKHKLLIDRLKWAYTTSANLSGKEYDETFAKNRANIIVYPLKKPKEPSKIYKLSKEKKKRIR